MPAVEDKKQVFKCPVCGNIVEVLHVGGAELVCCGQPMGLMEEKTQDNGLEKHVPIIEETESGYLVKVGSMEHPMEKEHFIEWVELEVDGIACRKFLQPEESPEAEFNCQKGEKISAREYCNLHGLWKSE